MGEQGAKESDVLLELVNLLKQEGRKQEAFELSALFLQFMLIEMQYGKVLAELAAMREQLAALHDGKYKNTTMQETARLQTHITHAKENLAVKMSVTERIKGTLAAVKQKGRTALNGAVGKLGIKKALEGMRLCVQNAIQSTQAGIHRLNTIGGELHAIGGHTKNLGRAIVGKRIAELEPHREDKGITAVFVKALQRHETALAGMEKGICGAITRIERLEHSTQKGKKTSCVHREAARPVRSARHSTRRIPVNKRQGQSRKAVDRRRKQRMEPER